MTLWRRFSRLSRGIRTIGGTAIILCSLLGGIYALWPFPKETRAQIIKLDERIDEHDEEIGGLEQNLNGFIMEQRVAMTRQEVVVEEQGKNAELTRDVMLQLLQRMDGE